ncbi:MAG TPA: hypothetical protein VGF67_20205 [Ktedonobacteraceae bacterium]|jgi:hypothetical protein
MISGQTIALLAVKVIKKQVPRNPQKSLAYLRIASSFEPLFYGFNQAFCLLSICLKRFSSVA